MGSRTLRWRRIPDRELELSRLDLVNVFAPSPDPYVSAMCQVEAAPLEQLIQRMRAETGQRVTVTHAMFKLIALAIAENPAFNRVVLDNRTYELDDIALTSTYLLPGRDGPLTTFLVENPHRKSLAELPAEFERLKEQSRRRYQKRSEWNLAWRLLGLVVRSGVLRFGGERFAFKRMVEWGVASNLAITNVSKQGRTNFLITRGAILPQRNLLRFYLHGVVEQAAQTNAGWQMRRMIPLTITFDHRTIDGSHLHNFVHSMERIAADPNNYLS